MFYEGTSGCLQPLLKEVHLYTRVWPRALAPCSVGVEAESNLFIFNLFYLRFQLSFSENVGSFFNHDAVKVFAKSLCLSSVLSLFLLDHLHQLDNYDDDKTVFLLVIKCTLFTKTS